MARRSNHGAFLWTVMQLQPTQRATDGQCAYIYVGELYLLWQLASHCRRVIASVNLVTAKPSCMESEPGLSV